MDIFYRTVVSFWGLGPRPHRGFALDPTGTPEFRSPPEIIPGYATDAYYMYFTASETKYVLRRHYDVYTDLLAEAVDDGVDLVEFLLQFTHS